MTTKAQVKTQAKTSAAPAAARTPQHPVAVPEHEAERPDIAAQLEGATRLGHSFGALGVDGAGPPIIQRQEIPEEEEEELQLKREPAAVQRQELPEEEEELMMKGDDQRVGPQGGQVPPEVEAAIRRARGGGQPLDGAVQAQMSEALGHDFSEVRVHTDSEADALNQRLQAKAFTTGADIFFKQGAYEPASSGGRELIAHELSHVVQQGTGRVNGACSGMIVRPAGDAFEQEAEATSRRQGAISDVSQDKARRPRAASTIPVSLDQYGEPHLLALQRAVARPDLATPEDILALQRRYGNRAVGRLLTRPQVQTEKIIQKGGSEGEERQPPQKNMFQLIQEMKLGLRVGTHLEGAAYAMSDFGFAINQLVGELGWINEPTTDRSKIDAWHNHHLNTIVKIFDLPKRNESFNLMIVSQARPTGERYNVRNGIGDNLTFAKCGLLSQASSVLAQRTFPDKVDQVADAVVWVIGELRRRSKIVW